MWNNIELKIKRLLSAIRQPFKVIIKKTNDSTTLQQAQIIGLSNEILSEVPIIQHYGFSSNPPPDTIGVAVALGGSTAQSAIVATEHTQHRVKNLSSGEVVIYTDEGVMIKLSRGRVVAIECDELTINCKNINLNAGSGKIEVSGVDLVPHTHIDSQGGTTSPPQ